MRPLAAFLIGAGLVASLAAHAAATQAGGSSVSAATGLILGRVADATTAAPIANVIVALTGSTLPRPVSVLTDAQGRFLFRSVPKGTFTLRTTLGGNGYGPSGFLVTGSGTPIAPYLNGGFGQRRPGGLLQPFDVGDGERIGDLVIRLWKGGSIDGTVLDEAGEPLVNVVVAAALRSTDGRLLTGPSTRTDDRGAYHMGTLFPGEYIVVVPQLLAAMPSTTSDALASTTPDRQMTARLANSMGMAGFAVGGIAVRGSTISTAIALNANAVSPLPKGDGLYVYQTTFAPSATAVGQASTLTVRPGEERSGVNVSLQPVRAVAVSGTLIDDAGPVAQFGVRLMPRETEDGSGVLDVASTSTDGAGRFAFPLVPGGAYRVMARRATTTQFADGTRAPAQITRVSDRVGAWAQQEIVVGDRDLSGLSLQLTPGVQVSGHVEFHGSGTRPPTNVLSRLSIGLERVDPISRALANATSSAVIDANDGFVLRDMSPGRYLLFATQSGWSTESVSLGNRQVADRAFAVEGTDISDVTVVLTDKPAEVTGVAHTRAGSPDSEASVLLFSTDQTRWPDARVSAHTFQTARVSKSGAFSLPAVVPGEYFVVAVSDDVTTAFPDVKFLRALAVVAKTIQVAAGDKEVLSLTTAVVTLPKTPGAIPNEPSEVAPAGHGPFVPDESSLEPLIPIPGRLPQSAETLSGVVTSDEVTPRPLRHAIVTATGAEITGLRQVVTDDEGRFVFVGLPPGRYSLTAEKPGYVKRTTAASVRGTRRAHPSR